MSNLHHAIPEDCQKYNNGLYCDFKKCPYIHCTALHEDALRRQRQHGNGREKNKSNADTLPIKMQNRWSQSYEKEFHEDKCSSSKAIRYQTSSTKKDLLKTKSNCKSTRSSYSLLECVKPINRKSKKNASISVKDQQNHKKNHVNQPHNFACLENKPTPEARVSGSEKNPWSENCKSKRVSKISPTCGRLKCESTIGVQQYQVKIRQIREELSNWAPERLKWIDNLSEERKHAYFQHMLKNQEPSFSTKYETKKQQTTTLESSGKQQRFHLFPRLPAEIRNQIWENARRNCAGTCHVLLDIKQEPEDGIITVNGKYETLPNPILDARFRFLYHVPGLYGACQESRSFVENLYGKPKMIAFNKATQRPYPSGKGTCILNFEQDRLFFISCGTFSQIPDLVKFMKREERIQIKHLAIPFRDYFHENITVTRSLVHFPNLQTLDLILGDDKEDLKRIGHNLDYSDFIQKSLREQHLMDDRDSFAGDFEDVIGDENINANGERNNKWSIPSVRTILVSKYKARAWKIDGFKWETTTKSVPPRLIEA
ncbi:hypothetical protein OnM2_084022 [Erysiphe neolycopersici]|uniref:2EXR domain-containing protein n=1 Tax=Erysiphe neolycopersici TaxID=212602 RepID=A0A420HF68_9PEZI|nr:hypothetical protein OnM2_084022 [Erysiphe neolycopersici]